MPKDELVSLVRAAQSGDTKAYGRLVATFQDMAYGYAYSMLGDFHLAEDAAQEAFVEAYCNLAKLHDAEAFAGWFRRIVQFRCHRLLREAKRPTTPLEESAPLSDGRAGPDVVAAGREMQEAVMAAIETLSSPLRQVTTLFYIDGYSHRQISAFLEVPVNTVKSRLNASRQQLSERIVTMVKRTLNERKPGGEFTARVIEGVPRVGFFRGGNACPESFTFPSCLAACLTHMGAGLGTEPIEAHGRKWRLNNTYVYLMGVSGEAFRLFWKPGWHLDNTGLLSFSDDSMRFIAQAFAAIGFDYELLHKDSGKVDEALLRQRIIESVCTRGWPALAFGVVGPPECAIVTGCDDRADVLFGWSFFQDRPEHTVGVDFEPCGYFRKRNWFKNTDALIVIGPRRRQPPSEQVYRTALTWAVELIRKPTIRFNGDRPNGLAAFDAWAATIARDEDLPAGDVDTLCRHHMAHASAVGMVAEGRWYATHFLRRVIAEEPPMAVPLQEAIACFEAIHQLMWQIWGLTGGPGFSPDKALKFADPAVRKQMVPLILQARDADAKAADAMERTLAR